MVIADLALLCAPGVLPRLGVIVIILALAGAVWVHELVFGAHEGSGQGGGSLARRRLQFAGGLRA